MTDADLRVAFSDIDPETNTVRVTLEVPKDWDPEITRTIFLNVIDNMQEDYR